MKHFSLYLIGFLLSVAAFIILPIYATLGAMGDVLVGGLTAGLVSDAGSSDPQIGFVMRNFTALMSVVGLAAALFLGLMIYVKVWQK